MRALLRPVIVPGLALAALAACSTDSQTASSAFSFPIDFSYACEGAGKTVAPTNDETAATLSATRMCPDLASGTQGDLFGVVLDRQPAQLLVLQLNPANGTRKLIDVDYFVPGVTGITVGRSPLRVLRAPDWSSFYVVSAGDAEVERIVIDGYSDDGVLSFTKTRFALPGIPIEAEVIGNDLIIAARDAAELWVYDLAANAVTPALTTLPVTDRVAHIEPITLTGADPTSWLVTFRDRRTVAILSPDGAVVSEAGLAPQCRDGLDNDGDGLTDKGDLDCRGLDDDDEGPTTGETRTKPPAAGPSFEGAPSCNNAIDDDGDGATDFPEDLACADADDDGELLPECDDGIDQDGDGLTDMADESCYAPWNTLENQGPVDGPYHPTFIDGGAFGHFVYVLDERLGEIAVFDVASGTLQRIDVNAADANPPALTSVDFGDFAGEVKEHLAIPVVRPPALHRQGIKNIQITETNASSLSSGRLRGELWDRIIEVAAGESAASVSLTPNSAEWKPSFCAPTPTDKCAQPALDDATWFAFGANLDGGIQLVEAIRRGTPTHRLAQRVTEPSLRVHDITAPRLTRRGALVNARGEPQIGLPFVGAALEEILEERVTGETPTRLRRFGIWPAADYEETPNETWTLTYQGKIPSANGALGRVVDGSHFADANARFCEVGVAPGDILQFEVPVAGVDPVLVHTLPVVAGDVTCPTRAPESALVEVSVTEVGMSTLAFDPASARLRPLMPVLDLAAIEAQRLSLRACRDALEAIDETLGLPDNLAAHADLSPAELPATTTYAVRGAEWVFVGSRSGFLHRQRWNRATGTCAVDDTLDPRLVGRASEVPGAVGKYATCPPQAAQLQADTVLELSPVSGRTINPSFGIDIFPACDVLADGTIAPVPSQQDTAFTFVVTGPQQGSALSIANSIALMRVPLLDFRRQQVQLDTAAKRAVILQLRLGDPEVVVVFD